MPPRKASRQDPCARTDNRHRWTVPKDTKVSEITIVKELGKNRPVTSDKGASIGVKSIRMELEEAAVDWSNRPFTKTQGSASRKDDV